MHFDLPINEAALAAPHCCEMCGQQIKEPEVRTTSREGLGEIIRYLAAMWFEERHAPEMILLRVACPHWTYDQIAAQLGISKANVGRIAQDIERHFPEMAAVLHIYAAKPDSQRARRRVEVRDAAQHTMADGSTWRSTSWERTRARLMLERSRRSETDSRAK